MGRKYYDVVVIATPYPGSGIALSPDILDKLPSRPYSIIHVTVVFPGSSFTESSTLDLMGEQLPFTVLTTAGEANILSILPMTKTREHGWVFKITSMAPIANRDLIKIFGTLHHVERRKVRLLYFGFNIFSCKFDILVEHGIPNLFEYDIHPHVDASRRTILRERI